jgi:hypothetical protein
MNTTKMAMDGLPNFLESTTARIDRTSTAN